MLRKTRTRRAKGRTNYRHLLGGIAEILADARRATARTVNALMTATYWEIGRRIVEFEQGGAAKAGYGESVLVRLSKDAKGESLVRYTTDNLPNQVVVRQ